MTHLTPPTEAERIEALRSWMIKRFGKTVFKSTVGQLIAADPLTAYVKAQQAEIERLREAAEGQLVVVNTAIDAFLFRLEGKP